MVYTTHLLVAICAIMYISAIVAHIYLLYPMPPLNGLGYLDSESGKCCNLCPRICGNQLFNFYNMKQ
ncbi:hypothetical protein RCNV-85A-160 [Raccoonpox virus]|nr:hypothetical protein RCNV-85A-160 [Raccoonpox virus]